jgi:phosphopantetheinyl transferase (holo-ACP synthase)
MDTDNSYPCDRKYLERVIEEHEKIYNSRIIALEKLMDERDRLYMKQFEASDEAVKAALVANEKQTHAAFAASKEAINKAEESQRSYNATHNDLTRKMDQQYKEMVPASEARLKWESTDKEIGEARRELGVIRESISRETGALRMELMREIQGLRESRSQVSGSDEARHELSGQRNQILIIAIAFVGMIAAIIALVLRK